MVIMMMMIMMMTTTMMMMMMMMTMPMQAMSPSQMLQHATTMM